MDIKYEQKFTEYKARFDAFLKCVELAGPKQTLGKVFMWAGANKIVEYIVARALSDKTVKGSHEKSQAENHLVAYPDKAAFEYLHWCMKLESKADWIPDCFAEVPAEIEDKAQKMIVFYQGCDSQIIMPN